MNYLLLFIFFLISCTTETTKIEEKPQAIVDIAEAICEKRPYLINTIGNLEAYTTIDIRPQATGELTGYYFKDGALIKKGDLLFTIDQRPYIAKLEEALGQLAQAKASLIYNESKVERYKGLLPDDYVSKLDYQQYVSNAEIAAAQVKEFDGTVRVAKINLGYCTIKAPADGLLGRHLKDPGNIVVANQEEALVTIKQIQPIFAYFTIAERFFQELQKYDSQGLNVVINQDSPGTLDFINNTIDKATGTIRLRALVENKDLTLWPGQFAQVAITLYEIDKAIVVPETAVNLDASGTFIYVAKEDQTVEKRDVVLGQQQGNQRIINKGIACGEKVVTQGQSGLYPGAHYRVRQAT